MGEGILSFSQELLLHGEIIRGRAPIVSRLVRIAGKLDLTAFASAAQGVVAVHEPLRSVCVWRDGQPLSKALGPADLGSSFWYNRVTSLDEAKVALGQAYSPAAYSAARAPKMLNSIVRVHRDEHLWAFGVHHIAADAVSMRLYGETFSQHYSGSPTDIATSTSLDYAQRQRNWLLTAEAQAMYEWWMQRIEAVVPERAPVRMSAPSARPGHHRLELRIGIGIGGRNAVFKRARQWRVPPSAIFYGAFALTAAARHPSTTVSILTNLPGRSLNGASIATGAFYNTVPLIIRVKGREQHAVALAATEALFEALEHQELPIALVNYSRTRARQSQLHTLIPLSFNVVDHPLASFRISGCRVQEIDVGTLNAPRWGRAHAALGEPAEPAIENLDWLVTVQPDAIIIGAEFDSGIWDTDDVWSMLEEYGRQLGLCLGENAGDTCGDPSLIVDWRNP